MLCRIASCLPTFSRINHCTIVPFANRIISFIRNIFSCLAHTFCCCFFSKTKDDNTPLSSTSLENQQQPLKILSHKKRPKEKKEKVGNDDEKDNRKVEAPLPSNKYTLEEMKKMKAMVALVGQSMNKIAFGISPFTDMSLLWEVYGLRNEITAIPHLLFLDAFIEIPNLRESIDNTPERLPFVLWSQYSPKKLLETGLKTRLTQLLTNEKAQFLQWLNEKKEKSQKAHETITKTLDYILGELKKKRNCYADFRKIFKDCLEDLELQHEVLETSSDYDVWTKRYTSIQACSQTVHSNIETSIENIGKEAKKGNPDANASFQAFICLLTNLSHQYNILNERKSKD